MRLFDMLLRIFRFNFSSASDSAPVLRTAQNWAFHHIPAFERPSPRTAAAGHRVLKARVSKVRRDPKAADACVFRILAARREELFHRPARKVA
jgi:hypothetical protein